MHKLYLIKNAYEFVFHFYVKWVNNIFNSTGAIIILYSEQNIKMEWAEDIKLSIRKTATRKGRRSKSRDFKDNLVAGHSSSSTVTTTTNSVMTKTNNPELSIDIILNTETNESTPIAVTSNSTVLSGSGASDGLMLNVNAANKMESKLPSFLRRISGGWAEPSLGKTAKSKKGFLDDDRFDVKCSKDTIPPSKTGDQVPEYDEYQSDNVLQEKHPQNLLSTKVCKPEEKILSTIADTDLSILTQRLQTIDNLQEADVLWEWQKLFTEVMADINYTNKPLDEQRKKLILKPDELPPPPSLMH